MGREILTADPEEPAPADMLGDRSGDNRPDEEPHEVAPEVQPDVSAALVQEEDVGDDDGHDAFIGGGTQARDDARPEERRVGCGNCLPDVGADDDGGADERYGAAAEDVGAGDDDEVCVAEGDDTGACLYCCECRVFMEL
jgi:hypothetical protein